MKIDRITLTWVRVPLVEPFRISNGEVAEKDGIVVELATSDGAVGFGESSPMAGSFYSNDTPESCWTELVERLAPAMAARGYATLADAHTRLAGLSGSNFAKTGIETALWDIDAQMQGLPLHRLLGGERDEVESGLAVGLYDSEAAMHGAIERYLAESAYKRVKIKIAPGHDLDLVRGVRARFGDALPLMTDANAAYNLDDHSTIFKRLDQFGLLMYEQPLAGPALKDCALLQKSVRTPICLDESLESLWDVERAAALEAFRIANIKIQRVGGFANALKVYQACMRLGLSIWVGTMPELGIGCAQGAALASLAGCNYPTDVEASTRWFRDDIIEPFIEVRGGMIALPDSPGLGYKVDAAKLKRYQVARTEIQSQS